MPAEASKGAAAINGYNKNYQGTYIMEKKWNIYLHIDKFTSRVATLLEEDAMLSIALLFLKKICKTNFRSEATLYLY